jgi:SAM-dependent methyltransferase
VQAYLDLNVPGWEHLTIHESSPSNDFVARHAADYTASQYFANVPRGQYRDGIRSENLEALTLPDESVDVFVTQDVLEHVFSPEAAIREIHRVLRPGGCHVFTTPKHKGMAQTVQRARITDGEIEYLLDAAYHGNPIGDNRALVTYDYGADFEQLLSDWSAQSVLTYTTQDRALGLDAEFNEVFVIRKPRRAVAAVADVEPRAPRAPRSRRLAAVVRPVVPQRVRPALRGLLVKLDARLRRK